MIRSKYRIGGRAAAHSTASGAASRLDVIPGQLLIRFKPESLRPLAGGVSVRRVAVASLSGMPDAVAKPLEFLQANMGLKVMTPLFATASPTPGPGMRVAAGRPKAMALASVVHSASEMLSGINMVTVDPKAVTPQHLKRLNQSPGVEFVEPMPARWVAARRKGVKAVTSADPKINLQWGLRAIGWFAQDWQSASGVDVAVLDTGVDKKHPELSGCVTAYQTNGFSKTDIVGHGTHVCGIIAALANNKAGIAGIADCRLHVWKIFPDKPVQGDFYVDGEAYLRSLREAADKGIRVVNLSIGGTQSSQTEQILFNYLTSRDVIVVAAMGNEFEDGNPIEYPAAYNGVVPVGAVDIGLRRAVFSNTGKHICIAAPGAGILSTLPIKAAPPYRTEVEYAAWDGTSMATPHVAGALALLLARRPNLKPVAARARLESTCVKVPAMKKAKFTRELGYGLMNLPALLK